ncbi:MAG: Hcp family type VI secretion system effector [Vicinamibacterales bacterium]
MAADKFLKLGDIKGESLDSKHKDEIEILSWSWGVSNSAGGMTFGSGGGQGKAAFQDLTFTHLIDTASPTLMQYCADGTHMKDGVLVSRKSGKGQQEYLFVKMTDVIITSVSHGSQGSDKETEQVALAFAKVSVEYSPQKPDGSLGAAIKAGYDLQANKVV